MMVEMLNMKIGTTTYKGFDEDIIIAFQVLIKRYKLTISCYDINSYMLYNDDFILTFIYNHGEIKSFIKYKGFIHEKLEIDEALTKLKVEDEVKLPTDFWNPKQVLSWYAEMTMLLIAAIEKCIATRKSFGLW